MSAPRYRHKDVNWTLTEAFPNWNGAQLCVLMDIRDELKRLNAVLHCHNFLSVPTKLDHIAENTTKARRRRKA